MGQEASAAAVWDSLFPTGEHAALILDALNQMAARGTDRHVDVAAALRAAAIAIRSAPLHQTLRLLCESGCINDLQPLADGGLLVTVTGVPIGAVGQAAPDR